MVVVVRLLAINYLLVSIAFLATRRPNHSNKRKKYPSWYTKKLSGESTYSAAENIEITPLLDITKTLLILPTNFGLVKELKVNTLIKATEISTSGIKIIRYNSFIS